MNKLDWVALRVEPSHIVYVALSKNDWLYHLTLLSADVSHPGKMQKLILL